MALPEKNDVDALVQKLAAAADRYTSSPDLDGRMARLEIIDAAKQLIRSVSGPEMTPINHGMNVAELVAIRTFMKLKVLEAIPLEGGISVQDLSKATGAQESLLERFARILVATGFLNQERPDGGAYLHTKFSRAYLLSNPGPGHLFLAMYDAWLTSMVQFHEYLGVKGQLDNAREPDDALYNPYTYSHKQEGSSVWEIMSQDQEAFETFQIGMAGMNHAIPVTGHFDFNSLKNSPEENKNGVMELIDVGGGHGSVLQEILDNSPDLTPANCMLQDRPEVIALSKTGNTLNKDVQRLEHDFMTEEPIKGAKAYFMRMISHDYPDHTCVKILNNLAGAMSPESRVLICDMVLPPRVTEIDFPAAVIDQAVMVMGGKERTQAGFQYLYDQAGLELVKVWRVKGVPGACVEGRLKRT